MSATPSTPAPILSRFPRVPLIWVVPILALGVAAWMLLREWRNHGQEITIEFADGSGLDPGQTKLEYKGVIVGQVKGVELTNDLGAVTVHVQLERQAEAIAREGAQFWIVQPEIGFGGISGLETLLSGSRLGVRPGEGAPATHFQGLENPPAPDRKDEGRAFVLHSERLAGLQVHAPVFYRDIKVGEIEAARLATDATGVQIRIRVQNPYVDLVRMNSRFWNAGSSPIQISLFGSSAPKKSLQSVITGAIEFATPDQPGPFAPDGGEFELSKEADKDWLKWSPRIPIDAPDTTFERPQRPKGVSSLIAH
ncbi:MAG: Mammalian cell entry related domain protein [Lacunisphaera sp.]|nr:Mammalian cell entry related domain protein [Lacunisphaera sp.]